VKCQSGDVDKNCVQVDLEYSYRESTIYNIMVVSAMDKKHNAQSFYFNVAYLEELKAQKFSN